MAVRYHRCTCHLRYTNGSAAAMNGGHGHSGAPNGHGIHEDNSVYQVGGRDRDEGLILSDRGGNGGDSSSDDESKASKAPEDKDEIKPQPWYFHVVASIILVVHGFTFLVPQDPEADDTDMVRTVARWVGYDMEWVKTFTPYAQGLASVFNISLGIVSWWTSKESERYNRLIQLRVFAFCINILHAYITGPIIYQNDELPLMAPGRIIGLFRLSYLTPGLMAAGVTEVIVEKEQENSKQAALGHNDTSPAGAIGNGGSGGGGGLGGAAASSKDGSSEKGNKKNNTHYQHHTKRK